MGQAYADSIPMLVISSVNKTEQLGMAGGRLHELPSQRNLTSGVTAFSHTLMRPDELPAVLSRAFAIFGSARPRPVHIEIPIDVITAAADHVTTRLGAIPSRPAPCPDAVSRAAGVLERRPAPGWSCSEAAHAMPPPKRLRSWRHWMRPLRILSTPRGFCPKATRYRWAPTSPCHRCAICCWVRMRCSLSAPSSERPTMTMLYLDGNFRIGGTLIRIDIDPEQLNRNFLADVAILERRQNRDAGTARSAWQTQSTRRRASGRGAPRKYGPVLVAQWPAAWHGQRRTLEVSAGRPPRHDRRRGFDPAGVLRQSPIRGDASPFVVQLRDRLRHSGLCIAGGDRCQVGCA